MEQCINIHHHYHISWISSHPRIDPQYAWALPAQWWNSHEVGGAPGAKVWLHYSHRSTEDCLVHCKAWKGGSWHRSRDLGRDRRAHCWQQCGTHVIAERTHASTPDCVHSEWFWPHHRIVPASWQALKLIVPMSRNQGNNDIKFWSHSDNSIDWFLSANLSD